MTAANRKATAPGFLTVAQAAAESGFTIRTIKRHIEKGALRVMRVGPHGRIRIPRSVFEIYFDPTRPES